MTEETTEQATVDEQDAQQAPPAGDHGDGQDAGQDTAAAAEPDWKAEAEKWKTQSRQQEKRAKENADAAKRLAEIEDAQKSETQRLTDQLAERDLELQQLKLGQVRRDAAATAGLPLDLLDSITAVDPDEALEQAQRIAAYIKPSTEQSTPPADFRQGARPQAPQQASADDWIRNAAGRSR